MKKTAHIYRILDANLNRLGEALRVLEEYYRFLEERAGVCAALKKLRHELVLMERHLGKKNLLEHRDTTSDCFSKANTPQELDRGGTMDLLTANFKRSQEATRVIEEYSKITGPREVPDVAKTIRFTLYKLEKDLCGGRATQKGRKGA